MYRYFVVTFAVVILIAAPIILSSSNNGYHDVTTESPTTPPRHILSLSTQEKRQFLDSFDYVFSDIDGVVWNLHSDILKAGEAFEGLKKAGKNLTYITNNSVRTVPQCLKKFHSLNMNVQAEEIWHPARSTVAYLQSIKFEGLIYIIACEPFKKILRDAGYTLIDGPNKIIEESFTDLARNVFDKQPVRAVIIDVDFNLSSAKLIRAHIYLRNPECMLVVGATDMLLPVDKNFSILGPGPFGKVIAEASQKEMITLGKPGKHLADLLLGQFNIKNQRRALMIGDMLEQDIDFGKLCGFQTLLVLSGGCTLKDMSDRKNSAHWPDYYADSMADIWTLLNDINKSNY